MTVSSETRKSGPYNGNGSTTVFAYGFRILDAAHISVVRTENALDTVLTTGFTVSGVGSAGGNVTFSVAPSVGQTITLIRNVPLTQEVDLENQGAYYAETVEAALDLAAQRDLQLAERMDRAILLPASSDDVGGALAAQLAADITRLGQSADEIDVVSAIADDVDAVAGIASDVALLADVSAILSGTASAVYTKEDVFTGNGSAMNFALTVSPASNANVDVWVGGAIQKSSDFSLSGNILTISPAVGNGVAVIAKTRVLVSANDVYDARDEAVEAAAEALALNIVVTRTVDNFPFADQFTSLAAAIDNAQSDNVSVVRLNNRHRHEVEGDFTIPPFMKISGAFSPVEPVQSLAHRYDLLGTGIILETGKSIFGSNGSMLEGVIVNPDGLVKATSEADALAKVAAWSGTAIKAAGEDFTVRDVLVLGFNKAFECNGFARPTLDRLLFDCANGIDLSAVYDIARVNRCHGWPFYTVHQTDVLGASFALTQRSGKAYYMHDTVDGLMMEGNFSYGYKTGLHLKSIYAKVIANHWIDNAIGQFNSNVGVLTEGVIQCASMANVHVDSCYDNFNFQHTGESHLLGVNLTSGQAQRAQFRYGAGSAGTIRGQNLAGPSPSGELVEAGVGKWDIDGVSVTNGGPTVMTLIDSADRLNFYRRPALIHNATTVDALAEGTDNAPAFRPTPSIPTGISSTVDGTAARFSLGGLLGGFWRTVASAQNWLSLRNSATGQPVDIYAEGNDGNVALRLSSAGTGNVILNTSMTWSGSHVVFGNIHMWNGSNGLPRIKIGAPTSIDDGAAV